MSGALTDTSILAGSSQASGYDIDNSARFNRSDGVYLSRTPSAGNRKTWTWSGWFKIGDPAVADGSVGHRRLFGINEANNDTQTFELGLNQNNKLNATGWNNNFRTTTAVYRDPSAWYHCVWRFDSTNATADDRLRLYVNGEQITAFDANFTFTQNTDYGINQAAQTYVGWAGSGTVNAYSWDGYLSEVHFIDGQSLAPSSFAETDEDTSQWKAIKYAGTYGTNGFYLKFADSAALGTDSSGNGNNWTPTNLAATDQMIDTPQNSTGGNFCTMNPLDKASSSYNTLKEGNLHLEATGQGSALSTFAVSSGTWYWECLVTIEPTWWPVVGFCKTTANVGVGNQNYTGEQTGSWGYKTEDGKWYVDGSTSSTYTAVSAGDIMQFALDMDNGKAWVGINNTWVNSGNPATGANAIVTSGLAGDITPAFSDSDPAGHDLVANFGADSSFAGAKTAQGNTDGNGNGDFYYSPPSGYLALCSNNLPDPSIALPNEHFDTTLVSGNGAARSITGLSFQPDFLWGKSRTNTLNHYLTDSVRGINKQLYSDTYTSENSATDIYTAFNSDGFSLGSGDMNLSGQNYVHWTWKGGGTAASNSDGSITSSVSANTTAGFSVVGWTGTGSNATVGHGLNQAPEIIINKSRPGNTNTYQWAVQSMLWASATDTNMMYLNGDAAWSDDTNVFQAAPTATVFSPQGGAWGGIGATEDYIAYCFHSVEGYSKIGKYVGNGNADGAFIYTGFRPAYILIKRADSANDWRIFDNKRDPYNVNYHRLQANLNYAEGTETWNYNDFVSNGFKWRVSDGGYNASGGTYLYMAFAESPFKTSRAR